MDLFQNLNDEQIKAVRTINGPLLILAGAGSGKTRVITHRIAYLIDECDVNPYRILAITFTNKAAKEMRERVDAIVGFGSEDVFVSTFHSMCVRFLRRFIENLGYGKNFSIYDTDDQKALIKDVLKTLQIDPKMFSPKTCMNVISSAKDELVSPEKFALNSKTFNERQYAKIYAEYQKRLKANNALDFDDIIFLTVQMFRDYPDTLQFYQRRFEYIMVDEYQDTNRAQFELIKLLASHENEEGETVHNLCVVGDDDQSIYRFRGADITNILNFEKVFKDTTVIKLEQNYRSTKNILAVANEVIKNNNGRKDKKLWTSNADGEFVQYSTYASDIEEASKTAEIIKHIMETQNASFKDFAVLYRTNAQSLTFEKIFRLSNLKAKTVGALSFFQRKEIKDIIAYLKTIDNGLDDMATRRIINIPKRGIGNASIDKIIDYSIVNDLPFYESLKDVHRIDGLARHQSKIESFVAFIEGMRLKSENDLIDFKELIEEIIDATDYLAYIKEEEPEKFEDRKQNLEELISFAVRYQSSEEIPTLTGFLEYCGLNSEEVSEDNDMDDSDSKDYISLMTLHSAKGLEFPYVFMVGMEEGIFPSSMSFDSEDVSSEIEEERRLCYVGITRAMTQLFMSNALTRMTRGDFAHNEPSRFIKEIPRHLLKVTNVARTNNSYRNSDKFEQSPIRSSGKALSNYSSYIAPAKNIGSAATTLSYEVGDTVKHIKFGVGTVTQIVSGGRDFEVTVDFGSFGVKKMLASFAKLQKVE